MSENDDLEARLNTLRDKQQDAQRRYAQAEARLDGVRARKEELLHALRAQGFDTMDAARARVSDLSAQTEDILTQIQEKVSDL